MTCKLRLLELVADLPCSVRVYETVLSFPPASPSSFHKIDSRLNFTSFQDIELPWGSYAIALSDSSGSLARVAASTHNTSVAASVSASETE